FGLRLPGSSQIAFISIVGREIKPPACHVLLGWEALSRFRLALATGKFTLRDMLEIPQLQLVLVDRLALRPDERALLRALARTYRGPQAWPAFRSHRVGFLPWMVDQAEADQLLFAVNQAMGVALRKEDHPEMLTAPTPEACWVRGQDVDGVWRESWLSPPPRSVVAAAVDADRVRALAALPVKFSRVQIDLSLSRALIGKRGARPEASYLLVVLDGESGICLGADMLQSLEGLDAMWTSLPNRVLDMLIQAGGAARAIEVASQETMAALRPLLGKLPIKLTLRARLDQLEAFRESLNKFYAGSEGEEQ
ncbi:MAG: hypothetical protein PHR35_00235, partial [Kiritimatiellae bacterium]|nr:hypothetical protein [Kiritimatiellia bacterium]